MSTPLARSLVIAPLAVLTCLSQAQSQVEVTWSDEVLRPGAVHFGVEALADGGALAVVGSGPPGTPRRFQLRRLTENGTRLWGRTIPLGVTAFGFDSLVDFDVAADGSSAFAIQNGQIGEILRVDESGQLAGRTEVESLFFGMSFDVKSVAIAPGGDLLVTGFQQPQPTLSLPGRLSVVRIDGAGNQVSRANEASVRLKASHGPDGDTFCANVDGNRVLKVVRYDSLGTRVWSRPLPVATDSRVNHIGVSQAGEVVVVSEQGLAASTAQISLVNADGTLAWSVPTAYPPKIDFHHFLANGDILLGGDPNVGQLQRRDGQGNLLWERGASPGLFGLTALAVDGQERIWLGTTRLEAVTLDPIAVLEEVDGNGATVQTDTLASLNLGASRIIDLAIDVRGNPKAAVNSRLTGGGNRPAITAKLVQGAPPAQTLCSPNTVNSTGLPGVLRALGSDEAAANNLTLAAAQLPQQATVLFLASTTLANIPGAGGSQGTLCLGGEVGRYVGNDQVRTTTLDGQASLQLELPETPTPTGLVPVLGGQTWFFQAWNRDVETSGAPTSNFTNGIGLTFQ